MPEDSKNLPSATKRLLTRRVTSPEFDLSIMLSATFFWLVITLIPPYGKFTLFALGFLVFSGFHCRRMWQALMAERRKNSTSVADL